MKDRFGNPPMSISSPAEIPLMDWEGNFAADSARFAAIDEYLKGEADPAKRAEAERLASWHGCGEVCAD